jgi:hypothetical protein
MFNSHDSSDRQVLAAVREYNALVRKRYIVTKLDRPIQRGWRRSYVLSESGATRPDRLVLEAILIVIGSAIVSWRRDFCRRRGRRRKLFEIEQPLKSIPIYEWKRKNYPDDWLSYFSVELVQDWNQQWCPHWVFEQPSLYELRVERNWLWYFREVDPAVETRLSELDRWLECRQGWRRYCWLKGRRQHGWWTDRNNRRRELRREHQREITRAIMIFPEVEPAAPTRRNRFSFRRVPFNFSRRSPRQRQRALRLAQGLELVETAQTSFSAGASPPAGTILRSRSPTQPPKHSG